ncbi:MAG: hypothetical protein AAFN70_09130, partial [Planctomycetota bacterium]
MHLLLIGVGIVLLTGGGSLHAQSDVETQSTANVQSLTSDNDVAGEQGEDQVRIDDGWEVRYDNDRGPQIRTRPLRLHLRDVDTPALQYRLFPDESQRVPGNAAIFYLKAMGFLEQQPAAAAVMEKQKQWVSDAREKGESEFKPSIWLSMDPAKIDLAEANEYLQLHSFQPRDLREAARRSTFDMDRRISEVPDPIGYLLPEIQYMRSMARVQSLRCRVAIAEGRVQDAMEVIQQQLALASHLGQEPFLISNLVGIAIGSIALNDSIYLMEHSESPNLYWAYATLPQPLVSTRAAAAYERNLLYHQLKLLRDVDATPRSVGYWNGFLDQIATQFGYFAEEIGIASQDPKTVRQMLPGFVIASYPGAKRYLIEREKMSAAEVDALPTTQVVFLALVRYYDYASDEAFKYWNMPIWQTKLVPGIRDEFRVSDDEKRYGPMTKFADLLLPAVKAARLACARSQQHIAMLQTVEAIRIYATQH